MRASAPQILARALLLPLLLSLAAAPKAYAQVFPTYSQYFLNPMFYNPAFTGYSGSVELAALYRQQWVGVEGAPTVGALTVSIPTRRNLAFGASVYNDKRGVLNTTTVQGSVATFVNLGKNQVLGGGLLIGTTGTAVDVTGLDPTLYGNDPALFAAQDGTFSLQAGVGLFYEFEGLQLAAAMPTLIDRNQLDVGPASSLAVNGLRLYLATASYRFRVATSVELEPQLLYRTARGVPSQLEGGVTVHVAQTLWAGASYRQDFGVTGYLGVRAFGRLSVGYAYEIADQVVDAYPGGTHEVYVGYRFAEVRRTRQHPRPQRLAQWAAERSGSPEPLAAATPAPSAPSEPASASAPATELPPPAATDGEVRSKRVPPSNRRAEPAKRTVDARPVPTPPRRTAAPAPAPRSYRPPDARARVAKSARTDEMREGCYVVIGAFLQPANARRYQAEMRARGVAAEVGYQSSTHFHYVYTARFELNAVDQARQLKEYLRREGYADAWVFTVQ